MSPMLKVYDNVPLPPINRTPKALPRKYPLDTMKVGQMVFVAGRGYKSLSAYISRISKNVPGRFAVRSCWVVVRDDKLVEVPEGTPDAIQGSGVWRVE